MCIGSLLLPRLLRSMAAFKGRDEGRVGKPVVGGVEGLYGSDNHVGGHAIGELVDVDGGLKEKRILVEVVLLAVVVDEVVVVGAADW